MTYYEHLQVTENASKMEIKKAYFKLVKQYPPEKYPEEFKVFRKAYEVLSDDNAREQYDKLCKVPDKYKTLYDTALHVMEYEDYEEAIRLLKEVVKANPDLEILNSLLGDIYLENENSGNAVKIFERLVKQEPDNAAYQGKLAQAYSMRGYTRKAIPQFEKSLEMDPDNISFLGGLANAYADINAVNKARDILSKGFQRLKDNNLDSLDLHICALLLCTKQYDVNIAQEQLEIIKKSIENDPAIKDYVVDSIIPSLIKTLNENDQEPRLLEVCYHIVSWMNELIPDREDLANTKHELKKSIIMNALDEDNKIPSHVFLLTGLAFRECGCISCKIETLLVQTNFIFEIETSRKDLKYLKEKHPDAYDINKQFYDKIIFPQKTRRLEEEIHKNMTKYQKKYPLEFQEALSNVFDMDDQEYDDYEQGYDNTFDPFEESEPYVRDQPKIGRNDPCPCGSGKKYKKCCGM